MDAGQNGNAGVDAPVRVVNVPEHRRYELVEEGSGTIGFTDYRLRPSSNQILLLHTEVDRAYTGRGLGARLARFALDDASASGLRIVPLCPYIATYLRTHHEWDHLIDKPATSAARPEAEPS
jgi:predicted GNAT family acetyltransferase